MKDSKSFLDLKNKYFKVFPQIKEEKTQAFATLIFTLIACSIFGFFAISPTISTIVKLRKELSDNEFVYKKLEEKITNLGILQNKYNLLREDFVFVDNAIPDNPNVPLFTAQVQALAKEAGVDIQSFQIHEVELSKAKKEGPEKYFSFTFSISATGSHQSLSSFISSFISFERISGLDVIGITKGETKNGTVSSLDLRGKAYFEK